MRPKKKITCSHLILLKQKYDWFLVQSLVNWDLKQSYLFYSSILYPSPANARNPFDFSDAFFSDRIKTKKKRSQCVPFDIEFDEFSAFNEQKLCTTISILQSFYIFVRLTIQIAARNNTVGNNFPRKFEIIIFKLVDFKVRWNAKGTFDDISLCHLKVRV